MAALAEGSPSVLRTKPRNGEVPISLRLLGGFELECDGRNVALPLAAQRLLAFLGLQRHPLSRSHVAGALWGGSSEERALASLRSTLWRINQVEYHLVDARATHISLARGVGVDLRTMVSTAHALIADSACPLHEAIDLADDLLPDWYEDWVMWERERLRQLRLHALEILALRLMSAGRLGEAVEASQTALRDDPLRESAHRVLIRVHLAEGNPAEALRQYRLYERMMARDLNAEPSPLIRRLVSHLTSGTRRQW
jgi:DNA-binding SARP family transcriptional activator